MLLLFSPANYLATFVWLTSWCWRIWSNWLATASQSSSARRSKSASLLHETDSSRPSSSSAMKVRSISWPVTHFSVHTFLMFVCVFLCRGSTGSKSESRGVRVCPPPHHPTPSHNALLRGGSDGRNDDDEETATSGERFSCACFVADQVREIVRNQVGPPFIF